MLGKQPLIYIPRKKKIVQSGGGSQELYYPIIDFTRNYYGVSTWHSVSPFWQLCSIPSVLSTATLNNKKIMYYRENAVNNYNILILFQASDPNHTTYTITNFADYLRWIIPNSLYGQGWYFKYMWVLGSDIDKINKLKYNGSYDLGNKMIQVDSYNVNDPNAGQSYQYLTSFRIRSSSLPNITDIENQFASANVACSLLIASSGNIPDDLMIEIANSSDLLDRFCGTKTGFVDFNLT